MVLEHCEVGHFSQIWFISLEKLIRSSRKFYRWCNIGQGYLHKILEVTRIRTSDTHSGLEPDSSWQKSVLSGCS